MTRERGSVLANIAKRREELLKDEYQDAVVPGYEDDGLYFRFRPCTFVELQEAIARANAQPMSDTEAQLQIAEDLLLAMLKDVRFAPEDAEDDEVPVTEPMDVGKPTRWLELADLIGLDVQPRTDRQVLRSIVSKDIDRWVLYQSLDDWKRDLEEGADEGFTSAQTPEKS